jgi:cell wall-associated NlpC family hydrolase
MRVLSARHVVAAASVLVSWGLLSAPAIAETSQVASPQASVVAAKVSRSQMLERAKVWLTANNGKQVPYDQTKTWQDGYRQDCSGYVSMAAALPGGINGPNTVALFNQYTVPINKEDMQPGDLFIDKIGNNNTRHVVIFEKWVDSGHTSYMAYEQRGGYGTDHRKLTYGLKADSQFKARRLQVITG